MLRYILSNGAMAGLFTGGVLCLIILTMGHQSMAVGMAIGYLTMLVGLSLVFVAIKRHRDVDRGGVIGFFPALGLGLGISLVAALLYALCWELALTRIGIDAFLDSMGPSIDAATRRSYHNPLVRLPMTMGEILPVGLLVSLVSAGLLRNPRFLPARAA